MTLATEYRRVLQVLGLDFIGLDNHRRDTVPKNVLVRSFFWSVFTCIRTVICLQS